MSPRKSHFRMTDELLEVLARILREHGGTNARGVPYTVQIYGERGGVDAHALQNACLDFDIEVGPALLRKLAAHGVDRAAFAARVRARCAELAAGAAGCGLILAYAERPRPKEALACAQCPRQALRAAGASEELAGALAYVPAHNLRGVDADEIEAVGAPPDAAAALAARLASVPETSTALRKADEYTMAADLFGPDVDVEAECRLECPVCGAVYDDDGEWVPRLAEADAPGGSAIPLRTDRVGFHAYAVANPEAYAERLAAASEGRDDWEAQGEAARPKATTTPELAAIENRARVALEEAGLVARARTGGRWWACDDREAAAAECFLAEVAEHHLDMRASAMRAEAAVGLRVPYTWKPRMKGRGRSAEPVGLDRGTRYDRLAVFAATGKPLGPGRPIASLPDAAAFLALVLRAATPALPAEVVEETRRARGEGLLQPASPPRTGAKKKRRSKVGGAGGSGAGGTAAQGSMAPARDAWEPVAARCEAATYARALKLSTELLHKACAVVSHAGRPLAPIVRGSTAADACCQPAG
ncbi:MAG: hypothetical protein VYE81_00545, partial [Planctomycetota bacterium]|nr:hypothetical protein [Planctomycetota bacterium]